MLTRNHTTSTSSTTYRANALRANLAISKKLLVQILALGLTASVFAVGLMFVAGYLISASADNIYSILMLNLPLAFVQIFGLGKPIARYFERLKSHDWVLRLTSALRYKLFTVVQAQERNNQRFKTGEVLESLAYDIEQVQNLYLRTVFPVLIAWMVGVLLVVIAGCFSSLLFVFALGTVFLLCFVLPALAAMLHKARIATINAQRAQLHEKTTDAVLGAQDIAIAGRGASIAEVLQEKFDALERNERHMKRIDRVRLVFIQVLLLVTCLMLVWWSAQQFGGVAGGRADWIVAVTLGFFPLIEIFAPLPQQLESGVSQTESLKRLSALGINKASNVSVRDKSASDEFANDGVAYDGAAHDEFARDGINNKASAITPAVTLAAPYDISFDQVSFAYSDSSVDLDGSSSPNSSNSPNSPNSPNSSNRSNRSDHLGSSNRKIVLEDITLTIPYGQKVAILGKSGSGKTTLARLLHGDIEPSAQISQGHVCIAGSPIAKIRDSIWDYIGLISQDSYIFAMSILDNLRIGKIETTESEAWDVLEAVDLKAYVETLPDGLNTMADEAGLRFSGGQRQRLVLARVLLQNPSIVILDEPTVGLDPITERVVLDTIQRVLVDKTVIMITHHLQGIEDFDRVLFLENGRVIMDGSPQELAQVNPRYQKLLMFDKGSLV